MFLGYQHESLPITGWDGFMVKYGAPEICGIMKYGASWNMGHHEIWGIMKDGGSWNYGASWNMGHHDIWGIMKYGGLWIKGNQLHLIASFSELPKTKRMNSSWAWKALNITELCFHQLQWGIGVLLLALCFWQNQCRIITDKPSTKKIQWKSRR